MRGTQAKKMRHVIFGDKSLRLRKYQVYIFKYITHRATCKGEVIDYHPKMIVTMGERRDYQILKKAYKRVKRTNE